MAGIAQKILANPAKYSLQQLRQGVENGIIPAYIGIPIIQERIQEQKEAQAMPMAQNQPPIAEQVLAESSGIDNLPSGLPQSYAGGGIIAFEEGGPVGYGIGGAVRRLAENASAPTEYKTATDLYRNILGREPESKEALEHWTATLGDTIDAEDVARFTSSAAPELIARTPAHISGLYQKYLNRAPDLGGAAYWGERFGDEVDDDELATFTRAAQDEIAARAPANTGGGGGGGGGGGRNDLARAAIDSGISYLVGPMFDYANAGSQFLQGNLPGAATSLASGLTGGISNVFSGFRFKEGGPVERYQSQGLVGTGESERKRVEETIAKLRTYGLRQRQLDPQGYAAAEAAAKEAQDALSNVERGITGGPAGAMGRSMGVAALPSAVTSVATPIIPYGQSKANIFGEKTPPAAPAPALAAAPAAVPATPVISGAGSFKMPTLPSLTLPTGRAPTDLNAIVGDMPAKTKKVFEDKVTEAQGVYEAFDKPGNEAREKKFLAREAGLEKDSAMNRALNLMSLGFGIAGSKERTVAGALGNEGRQGIADLIKGEAANRAAKDRLDDARDNFEQQKVAAKKGNYQAAQQAGQRAADDLRAGTQLTLQAGHFGNTEANQRLQLEQQGAIAKTQLEQQGILGLSELGLKKDQLNQNAAIARAQLQLGRERLGVIKDQIAAGNEKARATLLQAETKAASTWQSSPDYQKAQTQSKKMAPIEAQKFMYQEWLRYKDNMLPSLLAGQGGGANIPTWAEAMKAVE
jgi:hypothetical protein